ALRPSRMPKRPRYDLAPGRPGGGMKMLPGNFSGLRSRGQLGLPQTLARSQALRRSWPVVLDLVVACIGLAIFYGIVQIARLWFSQPVPDVVLSLSPRALPRYALYSCVRMGL